MPLIGYARVSTEDQTPLPQVQALTVAGCGRILEEHASGRDRARPVLARVLEQMRKGDTLVVVPIDQLARSLSHLLEVIEQLEARGAFFRSIEDPIDFASPQGKFTLQVLGAAAEFERALIRERTKAGLASARSAGRVGNPGLRSRDPAALRKVRLARHDGYVERLAGTAQDWIPQIRHPRLCPRCLPAEDGLGPRRTSRQRRPPVSPRGADPRCGPRHHPDSHLRPTGSHARAHPARTGNMAAFLGQAVAGAGGKARNVFTLNGLGRG
jgi:DNA invertase Pin-like site-specific DNA recombinase